MSLNPPQKQLLNQKIPQQQNVSTKTPTQIMGGQTLQFLSTVEEDTDVLSNISESISNDKLNVLITYLKQRQPNLNMTIPKLERKQKTNKLQKQELLSKYPTAEQIAKQQLLRQKILQEQEDMYGNMNIRGDSILEYKLTLKKALKQSNKKTDILKMAQKLEQEQLRQVQLQEQEDQYGSMNILGDSLLEYDLEEVPYATHNKPRKGPTKKREILIPEHKMEQEQLRQVQLQEQEDQYGSMNILGDSVLEYDLEEVPYATHNKPRKEPTKKQEILIPEHKMEQEQLREVQLQEQEDQYGSMNILGDTVLEYDLEEVPYATHNKPRKEPTKKGEIVTPEQKLEREELRQMQLQEQEDLYDQMDLLGETILEFSPLQTNYLSKSIENIEGAQTIISIPSDITPQTSSGAPHRISKYLSPEQVAQLAKIRRKRYEQQDQAFLEGDLYGESITNKLKENYSFRQPNARLQSPRELVYRKSIVNVKQNKQKHAKHLVLPVMNFPPTNWPTPIIPEVRQDLENLRNEQRQYFLSMQKAQAQQKSPNQNEDQGQSISNSEGIYSKQNQNVDSKQNQSMFRRNLVNFDDEANLSLKEDRRKLIKYVFIILFIQWSLITGIVSFFKYYEPSFLLLESSGYWTWLYILCTLILVIISFIILPITRNLFPINLMMLTLFTLLIAFMFSFVEIFYQSDANLFALVCACAICFVLTLFFCQTRCNFTIYYGLSLCCTIILLSLVVFYLLLDVEILKIVYATIGVTVYSIYLVIDTRIIVKGKSVFHIELDNYILGAIHLNLDFIFIILEKLQCL